MNNNSDNKFFVELGAVFNPQGFEEAEKKVEKTNSSFEQSFSKLNIKTSSFASDMSRFIQNSTKSSSSYMDNFFSKSSKGFLDFEALTKKVFNNILSNFLSMTASMLSKSLLSGIGSLFGGGSMLGGLLGSRETGGAIPQTGPYLLHGGEYVLPKGVVDSIRNGIAPTGTQGGSSGTGSITVNTPINITNVSSSVDVKYLAEQITEAARRGAAWAVEYSKVSYKIGKKREGEVSL